ncbi:MAG: Integrase catalytic region [Marmoricola sp.]|nr:Integrase catalytic region [Marmoricola sp.]
MFRLVQELAGDGIDVAVACRVLKVSRSGYYEWRERPSARDIDDAYLANTMIDIHAMSRGCYGAPRLHAELRMGLGVQVGCKRVARLLRVTRRAEIGGNTHKKRRKKPDPAPHEDLVKRQFVADEPDRLWCTDITEHPTRTGKVYCCAVLDVFSRVIVGWSIADHMRSELVLDALQMATWRRRPEPGANVHADRGSQYTSWVFGHRLRAAGLLGSMGRVASSVHNTMMESFWSTLQRELLETQPWSIQEELASSIFEWIEAWYNPPRRHTSLGMRAPHEFETLHTTADTAA